MSSLVSDLGCKVSSPSAPPRRISAKRVFDSKIVRFVFLSALFAAPAYSQKQIKTTNSSVDDSADSHVVRAQALERNGFYREAEAELLSALTRANRTEIPKLVDELKNAQADLSRAEAERRAEDAQKNLRLAEAMEGAKEYDRAIAAYEKSYSTSNDEAVQVYAKASIERVIAKKKSAWFRYGQEWAVPAVFKIALGFLGAFGLYFLLRLVYAGLSSVGRSRGRRSQVIEIREFADTTDTGMGKGFPEILRNVYEDYQEIAEQRELEDSVLLTYRADPATMPVIGSSKYEEFSEIKLSIAGLEVSELLSKMDRLVRQPRYTIDGAIYRVGSSVLSSGSLRRGKANVSRWNSVISGNDTNVEGPISLAYEIIAVILEDWHEQSFRIE
jgi:tetratricopeptide (TPR) repeat protein